MTDAISKPVPTVQKNSKFSSFGKFNTNIKCSFDKKHFKKMVKIDLNKCVDVNCLCKDNNCVNVGTRQECPADCRPGCQNQKIRKNEHAHIEVKTTVDRGNGLYAKEFIEQGKLVTVYCGPVIPKKKMSDSRVVVEQLSAPAGLEKSRRSNHQKTEHCTETSKAGDEGKACVDHRTRKTSRRFS
ncbi:hypothetical protein GCK72_024835 [Caenorhabditis remanei]|uniref:AWS domain-containing protein n=1 Tax=Caenorhabditis remanei TaxID=31234 RepID=A0A6A5G0B8_CAERE|nr:hypothetical protein GCK72_024835 [Caenorhabditis remanei]KAF1748368.1 hypothetical protein GCK72_024835 [Caenorhabditis remanei]